MEQVCAEAYHGFAALIPVREFFVKRERRRSSSPRESIRLFTGWQKWTMLWKSPFKTIPVLEDHKMKLASIILFIVFAAVAWLPDAFSQTSQKPEDLAMASGQAGWRLSIPESTRRAGKKRLRHSSLTSRRSSGSAR